MQAVRSTGDSPHIRIASGRILEVFRYAMKKSSAFEDLVSTLEQQDRIVYVVEGRCSQQVSSCLHLTMGPGGRNLQVRIDPWQTINVVAARMAHELYHASEIGQNPAVVDGSSLRSLYEQIGHRNPSCTDDHPCWETRAAIAFEALVTRQLYGKQKN